MADDNTLDAGSAEPMDGASDAYQWISIMDVEPGMVLARKVVGGSGAHGAIQLSSGTSLSANAIAQMINKGVECVAVRQEALPDPVAQSEAVQRYEARLHEIFGPCPDESCAALLQALLAVGPCQC